MSAPATPAGPTLASAKVAGHVAVNTAIAGVPCAAVAAYFLAMWTPGGHPLPPAIVGALSALVAGAAGFLWHLGEIGLEKLQAIKP